MHAHMHAAHTHICTCVLRRICAYLKTYSCRHTCIHACMHVYITPISLIRTFVTSLVRCGVRSFLPSIIQHFMYACHSCFHGLLRSVSQPVSQPASQSVSRSFSQPVNERLPSFHSLHMPMSFFLFYPIVSLIVLIPCMPFIHAFGQSVSQSVSNSSYLLSYIRLIQFHSMSF